MATAGDWAHLEWNENWVTFLDGMIQSELLQVPGRLSVIPFHFPFVTIDPARFIKHTQSCQGQGKLTVRICNNKPLSTLWAPGIVLRSPKKHDIRLQPETQTPLLLEEIFSPFYTDFRTPSRFPWTEVLELVVENHFAPNINVLVLAKDVNDPMWDEIHNYFRHQGQLQANIVKSESANMKFAKRRYGTDKSSSDNKWNLVITDAEGALQLACRLTEKFVISVNFDLAQFREAADDFRVAAIKVSSHERLTLLKKKWDYSGSKTSVEISSQSFDWIMGIQKALKASFARIYVWTRHSESGIVGLVRCLRKEAAGDRIRCLVFPHDESVQPNFENPNAELREVMEKDLAINVYEDKNWGSYAHVPLSENAKTTSGICNICLCNPSKDGVPGVRWMELPLSPHYKEHQCSVSYASINFRDVMVANGALQGFDNPMGCLGIEFSGQDSEGIRVMGLAPFGSLSTYVTPYPEFVWRVPDHWTLEDAATVPIAYSTAYWALVKKGHLRRNQSVLIHSGAGGTGLAAIRVASSIGCEVFTTVGSQAKAEELLKLFPQLRRERIGNSRDETFVEMVLSGTKGRGVNVVLNSLTGELVVASFQCVSPGGKFIDISGAHLIYDTVKLDMSPFLNNVEYHGVFINQLQPFEKKLVAGLVQKGIEAGTVVPLERSVFSPTGTREAMQLLMKGLNVGKILLNMLACTSECGPIPAVPRIYFQPDRIYIVVGGLGGIGFELVNWLVERGARKVTVVSRSCRLNGYHSFNLQKWKKLYGATVSTVKANICDAEVCRDLLEKFEKTHGVSGIFISALVLKDGPFTDLVADDFVSVYNPKATVTINMDETSRQVCEKLDYFVVFSSVAGAFGNEFQSNYGYANVHSDRICDRRAKMGHHALALQLGPVADVGYVAEHLFQGKEISVNCSHSYKPQAIVSVLQTLEHLLILRTPVCSSFIPLQTSTDSAEVTDSLPGRILGIMGADLQLVELDPSVKLKDLGLDSLSSPLIRQILQREYKMPQGTGNIGDVRLSDLIALDKSR